LTWLGGYFDTQDLLTVEVGLDPPSGFSAGQRGQMSLWVSGRDHLIRLSAPDGIPRDTAAEVLAHEYGHALLAIDPFTHTVGARHQRTDRQEEGFCEVLRWLWIDAFGVRDRTFRLDAVATNGFDVYREGFIECVNALQIVGSVQALREWLCTEPTTAVAEWVANRPAAATTQASITPISPTGRPSISQPRPVIDLIAAAPKIAQTKPDPLSPVWSSPRPVLRLGTPVQQQPRRTAFQTARPSLPLK
jgi:hypothetical protein